MTSPSTGSNYYEDALELADRRALEAAGRVQGLTNEIALLRTLLRKTVTEDPSNWEAYLEHVKQLIEATVAQQKLGADDSQELNDAINGWLTEFADALRGYNPTSAATDEERPL